MKRSDSKHATSTLRSLAQVAKQTPVIKTAYNALNGVRHQFMEPTFDSPVPSLKEIRANEQTIWGDVPRTLPGIDLNEEHQLALFDKLKKYYGEMPFRDLPQPGLRYSFDNEWFGDADAILLYAMLRHLKPRRIIEIGSGFSSAVTLDTNDRFLDGSISCTFIEPYPERLYTLLGANDHRNHTIIPQPVQYVELDVFRSLGPGDILFVDSSHVSKVHSDVNWILFEIMPLLCDDVVVHFHDVLYPFEYPKEWFYRKSFWNETYLLKAFLQYNSHFRIEFFNSFMGRFYRDRMLRETPRWASDAPGTTWSSSLWLRKLAAA